MERGGGTNFHELKFEATGRHASRYTEYGELREMRWAIRRRLLSRISLQPMEELMLVCNGCW